MFLSEWIRQNGDYEIADCSEDCIQLKLPWAPTFDEKYAYIAENSYPAEIRCGWDDDIDEGCIAIGNCFETIQEAEQCRDRLVIRQALLRNGGRTAFYPGKNNYYVSLEAGKPNQLYLSQEPQQLSNPLLYLNERTIYLPFTVYFDSSEMLDRAVKKIGENRIRNVFAGAAHLITDPSANSEKSGQPVSPCTMRD